MNLTLIAIVVILIWLAILVLYGLTARGHEDLADRIERLNQRLGPDPENEEPYET